MKQIELEHWTPSAQDPRRTEYAGQRTAQEVFAELEYRLNSTGYLPDEYFLMDSAWENGREIPKDADIFCTTDYGGSEGVYLDVYLKWHEDGKPITKSFITGKTLGESGADLDRMFLISAAITKAFHGDGGSYARCVRLGEPEESGGAVVHLSADERRTLIDALVDSRNHLLTEVGSVEQLLRRMTGSIMEFVNEVGQRPLQISDFDRAALAVQDGDLESFQSAYPKAMKRSGELLGQTAARPGAVGRKMTMLLLADAPQMSGNAYLTACKNAVDIGDAEHVLFLVKQAEHCVKDLDMSLYGEVIGHAYLDKRHLAEQLIAHCTPEQIAAAPPYLLYQTAMKSDYRTATALVEQGINANQYAAEIIRTFAGNHNEWITEQLLEKGMRIDNQNYSALYACVDVGHIKAAELLLERGMDFEQYRQWAEKRESNPAHEPIMTALAEHWESLQSEPEQVGQQMGGQ